MQDSERLIHERVKRMVIDLWTPNAEFGHGIDHANRVYDHAIRLAPSARADVLPVGAAAYLMDAGLNTTSGRHNHVARSVDIAKQVIGRLPALTPWREILIECIQYHEAETDVPSHISQEAMVVHDSDTLDRMGFSGVAMTIAYGRWIRRRFCSQCDPMCTSRDPDLDAYTLDYIVYTRALSTRLLLPAAMQHASRKVRETSAFLDHVHARLKDGGAIDHSSATEVLGEVVGGFER